MTEEIKPNAKQAPTQDAQLAADNIAAGEEKAPAVDFDADYSAAQKYSVSDVDRTGEGVKAAEEATKPEHNVSEPKQTQTEAKSTGNPDDYKEMAEEVNHER